ncbi:LysR family transcriptional regulator [Agarivorans sp. B2Z047]|uniref:LysR family transcriptional regulator n=1 Tax=Agarivorans sp. B2Z047 TaxID=2652721 RepID=UPI00128B0312|nr:LysR family transcriptional regulator [Agarivorans sp. B2Z047]MPW29725.1 LysR family transcriptional regulator [Agarivorans sp. B2Z047]UQN43292.1 LysR family transcriptional regulator [Agarivorans sp. B2Z047]
MMDEQAKQAALEAFVYLAKHGNLIKCAEQLKCTEIQVIQRIDQLEKQLACCLFNQHAAPFPLSSAGLALIEQAELIVSRYHELQRHCRHLQLGKSLKLSISYQAWFPSPWLTLLANQLQRFDPLLDLHFSGNSQQHVHFSFSAQSQQNNTQVLSWRPAKLIKVAHPKLVNHQQRFDGHLKLFDIREPQQSNLFIGETLLLDALEAALGWAILPQISVESRLAEGQLKAWPDLIAELPTYLHLSHHCPEDIKTWLLQQQAEYCELP